MQLIPGTKEPLFATAEKRRGQMVLYYDHEGLPASVNFAARENYRACSVCGNCCVTYIVDDRGEYTCSACGKFPRELLLS